MLSLFAMLLCFVLVVNKLINKCFNRRKRGNFNGIYYQLELLVNYPNKMY